MPSLRAISRLFAMEWSRIIQYRADAFLWTLAEASVPLISLAIWYTVAQTSSQGPTPTEVFTYYILVMFIKIITEAWVGAFLAGEILNGEIVQDLVRPIAVVWKHLANNLLEKLFKLLLPLPALLLVLMGFPQAFSAAIYNPIHISLFAVSLTLAVALAFVTDMTIGILAFWLEDAFQIRRYKVMLESVASGVLIPFSFMPPLASTLFGFLPFRYIVAAPAEIILGQAEGQNALMLLGLQALWIAGLIAVMRILWLQGLKRYAVPGQ